LATIVPVCVRFLDNVIDMNRYPIPQIADISRRIRRIGLGVMCFADACMRLNIPYDSEEAVAFAEKVMAFIEEHANAASAELAGARNLAGATTPPSRRRPAGGPARSAGLGEARLRRGARDRSRMAPAYSGSVPARR